MVDKMAASQETSHFVYQSYQDSLGYRLDPFATPVQDIGKG